MSKIYVEKERVIEAAPDQVYAVLSDYRGLRPHMLTANFLNYAVEQGGKGDGTVVSYRLRAANRERPYRMQVKEPVRGEVITERDTASSLVTTWTLFPLMGGQRTKVRVSSEWEGGSGVGGFFERTFAPLGLGTIYSTMLDALSGLAGASSTGVTPSLPNAGEEQAPFSNAVMFFLIFGAVVGVSFGIGALLKRRQQ